MGPDLKLARSPTLNVALILFGWRRYVGLPMHEAEAAKVRPGSTDCLDRRHDLPKPKSSPTAEELRQTAVEKTTSSSSFPQLNRFKAINDATVTM
jgi:hypothetical protein